MTWVAVLLSLLLLPLLLLLLPLLLLLLKGWYEVEFLPLVHHNCSAVYSATVLHIVCNDAVFLSFAESDGIHRIEVRFQGSVDFDATMDLVERNARVCPG